MDPPQNSVIPISRKIDGGFYFDPFSLNSSYRIWGISKIGHFLKEKVPFSQRNLTTIFNQILALLELYYSYIRF